MQFPLSAAEIGAAYRNTAETAGAIFVHGPH